MIFIDTNVAIDLRDEDGSTLDRITGLVEFPFLPVMAWIELEQGVFRNPAEATKRRQRLDRLLGTFRPVLFADDDIHCYGRLVAALGYSRSKTADRLIAAQCITRKASLITRNPRDFREIEGLALIEW